MSLPPGLLGKIAGIPLCSDADASAGSCPEASRVGTVTAGAGVGPAPFFIGGKAYLTGPYNGGPYGLAIEVPAVAGPFNLGMVVVRQSIRVDPHTAQVTAVSDAFPTILDGVPLRVRRVDVTLDRPGFLFNPTSCDPMAITGSFSSTAGTSPSSCRAPGSRSTSRAASTDAPISSFTFALPEGPHSGLAAVLPAKAKGSMCGTSLTMPFTITGHNGALLRQNTKIHVTGE